MNPVHAGNLHKSYSRVIEAAAEDGQGNVIELAAGIDNDTLQALRFRALGCPHLIAGAEYFCSLFEGRESRSLREFDAAATVRELEIPMSKTGRILLLEDAIQLLRQKIGDSEHT